MYNYKHNVCYKWIEGDAGDTEYRKNFLIAFDEQKYNEYILKKQDNILEKFKNNSKFIDILEKAKKKDLTTRL